MLERVKGIAARVPGEVWHIAWLFVATRAALTVVGVMSRLMLKPYHALHPSWINSPRLLLDIWGVWDSAWYLDIAEKGYSPALHTDADSAGQANYNFFPLYPLLVRAAGWALRDAFVAGLVVSNVCLLLAAWVLHRLVRIDHDERTARASVASLFLFPTAFILSDVYSESLFLLLLLLCFWQARRGAWHLAGVAGFFLALTRSVGVVVLLPLFVEHVVRSRARGRLLRPDVVFLVLVPLGLLLYMFYTWRLTGDFLAVVNIQVTGWGHATTNPLASLASGLFSANQYVAFGVWFTVAALAATLAGFKALPLGWWVLGLLTVVLPVVSMPAGSMGLAAMPRYILVSFPLFVLMGRLEARWPEAWRALAVALAIVQGFLWVFWCNGFPLNV